MSIIETLKNKVANSAEANLEEVSQPILDRISDRVSGGAAAVWCRASWGSGCGAVNVENSQL